MSSKVKVKIEGEYIRVTGDCPICDWKQPHSHVKEFFHEHIERQHKERHPSSGLKGTTNADKPAPAKTSGVTIEKKITTPGGTTIVKTTSPTPVKPKKINVYRIRTVGGGLNLDRSVVGGKKKEAIETACAGHVHMLQLGEADVRLVFCRYIGQYSLPETSKYGSYGSFWDFE